MYVDGAFVLRRAGWRLGIGQIDQIMGGKNEGRRDQLVRYYQIICCSYSCIRKYSTYSTLQKMVLENVGFCTAEINDLLFATF